MRYLVCFLCGAMWTMFLTLEKHFVFKGRILGATLCGFVIAVLSVLLFKYYAYQQDLWEIFCYALGCATSTCLVMSFLRSSRT